MKSYVNPGPYQTASIPSRWWGVFSPTTGNRLVSHIDYARLLDIILTCPRIRQNPFFFINHNSELLNYNHENILNPAVFSLSTIQEIDERFKKIPTAKSIVFGSITMPKNTFLCRLMGLSIQFQEKGMMEEAKEIIGLIESVTYLNFEEVTITDEPNLFALDNKLHPDIACKPIVRQVLSGFVCLREILREEVLYELVNPPKKFCTQDNEARFSFP